VARSLPGVCVQRFQRRRLVLGSRNVARSLSFRVLGRAVCAGIEQRAQRRNVAQRRRDVQRRGAVSGPRNTTSIPLDRAGIPKLGGGNQFFPLNIAIPGMAITGTISDTAACTTAHTINAATDEWEVWDAFKNVYAGSALSTHPARYDITSTGNSCPYTLL